MESRRTAVWARVLCIFEAELGGHVVHLLDEQSATALSKQVFSPVEVQVSVFGLILCVQKLVKSFGQSYRRIVP